jgi:predicted PurR-regulated permease PerM
MPAALTSATARNALVVIAVILAGAALRWMTDIITPLLLAMFLMIMVDGFGRVIRRHAPFLPSGVAIIIALVVSAIIFALIAIIVADNAGGFFGSLAGYEPKLNAEIAAMASRFGVRGARSINQIFSHIDPGAYLGTVANAVQGFASSALLVLIYLGFLVASRHAFERKAVKLFHDREERQEALAVFLRVRDGIERYLWIQTVLGLVIAIASWVVMMLIGLDNALFWAFLVFIVNYIPIVGAIAAIGLPALFALVQFDGYGRAALLLAGLWMITFFVGNIMLPRMQGESLNMDPLIVLLSLAFWGAIWGLAGMFLSTPLTVLAMAILAQFEGSRWIAILLSANGDPQGLGKGSEKSPDEPPAPSRPNAAGAPA